MSNLHVRYNGESYNISFDDIFTNERLEGIGVDPNAEFNANQLNPEQIKMAISQHFDVAVSEFNDFQVEYHKNRNITVRPDAVFGDCSHG